MTITEARKIKVGDKVQVGSFPEPCTVKEIIPAGTNKIVFRFENDMHLLHIHIEKIID